MNKTIEGILCVLLLTIFLGGCSKKEEIHIFEDRVYYNLKSNEERMTIIINYVFTNKEPKIELNEVNGTSLGDVSFILENLGKEEITNKKHNGYHAGAFVVEGDVSKLKSGDNIEIQSIKIKVNDKEEELIFKENLIFTKNDFEDDFYRVPLQPLQIVNTISINEANNTPVSYEFETLDEFKLTNFQVNNFVNISDMIILVNDRVIGKAEDVLPIDLKEGDYLGIDVTFTMDEEKKYANIMTDVMISGLDKENEIKNRLFRLAFIGLTDIEDLDYLINTLAD